MLIDLETASFPDLSDADLCIIGSGAAGLTLAQEMLGSKLRVVLLEAGGLSYTAASQDAYAGRLKGQALYPLEGMRLRYFGGTTGHWSGLCRPLDEADFLEKSWVPDSGWPIRKSDLDPYIARTHQVLDLHEQEYSLNRLASKGQHYLDLAPTAFEHQVWRVSPPTRFGSKYKPAMTAAPNIQVLLNANVTELVLAANGDRISQVTFKDPKLKTRTLRARHFVLAAGGIENARLLLASRSVKPAGVGNDNDLVGRYFHDHPHVNTGTLNVFDHAVAAACENAYPQFRAGSNEILPAIVLAPSVQQREKTLNNAFSLLVNRNLDASAGYMAIRRLLGKGGEDEQGKGVWDDLKILAQDLDGAAVGLYNKAASVAAKTASFRLLTRTEQAPNPNSRVVLNEERDAFGLPRVTLDWQLGALDKHTLKIAGNLFAQEVGRLGIGRVQLPAWLVANDASLGPEFNPGCHHMGTTRMAASPKKGVVDANCRVFGVSNLYIGGSSVFPTGGFANPTFTIVQLALRLADHLKTLK